MENQPTTGRQWFRLASTRIDLPQPAPAPAPAPQPVTAGPQPRRGPPIRQASIALARSNLALETATPTPETTQTQPPPPPALRVATPPPTAAAAPPPTTPVPPRVPSPQPTVAPPKAPTPPPAIAQPTTMMAPTATASPRVPSPQPTVAPPKTPTPPPVIAQPTTITIPRTITPPTTVTLPRTITPTREPTPPPVATVTLPRSIIPAREPAPPPVSETPERKFYRELTPPTASPKPATPPPPTVVIQPQLARPPSGRSSNGNDSAAEKPFVATPTVDVIPRSVATRALTPPESPKVIKTSPTLPQSPRIKLQQSATNMMPTFEPEPRSLLAPQPKSNGLQDNSGRNDGPKMNSSGQGELQKFMIQQADTRNAPPPIAKKEEKYAAMTNGKAFTARKEEKEMRIITIAGENHGAIMDLGSGHQIQGRKHLVHNAKGHESEAGSDAGNYGKMSNAMSKTKPMISLTNSNVQCVNNSILFNASSVNQSPGVHINFTRRHQPKNITSSTPQGGHPTHH